MAKYIYLISVLESLDRFSYIIGFFLFFVLIFFSICNIVVATGEYPIEEMKIFKKIGSCFFIVFIVIWGINVFIPSKEEMYTIFLSEYITIDNYNIVKNEIKEGIDYLDKVLNEK